LLRVYQDFGQLWRRHYYGIDFDVSWNWRWHGGGMIGGSSEPNPGSFNVIT